MRNKRYVLILIISVLVFTGCNTATDTLLVMSPTIKTIYFNTLKELVNDKTITQSQSNKVFGQVKMNMSDSKGCIYGLNELVMDGIINKSQADIINIKIQIAMKKIIQN